MHRTTPADISLAAQSPPYAGSATPLFDRFGPRLALWAVVSILFAALIVQYSIVRGRLLLPAGYDDVTYLADGLDRLQTWYGSGLWAMMMQWRHHPAHSPFSTVLAMAGFALFGMHDWGPYALDAVIVFTLLVFVDRMMGTLRLRWKIAAALVCLCVPITGQSIAEFRPDMMAGLLSAMLVVMLLDGPLLDRRPGQLLAAGAVWGITLWVKPSVFPVTLGLGGLALGLATVRDIWLARPRPIPRSTVVGAWLLVGAPALILPLPQYLVDGRTIVGYILENEVGSHRAMWQLQADRMTHLLYYSTGQSGQAMLGLYFWVFLAVMTLGAAILLALRNRRIAMTMACGGIVALAAYVVPTINPQKQPFLATPFDFLLLFGALLVIRQLAHEKLPPLIGLFNAALATALVLVCVRLSGFPGAPGNDPASADVRITRRLVAGVYAVIRDHYQAGEKQVWLNVTGPLCTDLLRYEALKDHIPLVFTGNAMTSNLDLYRKGYDRSDYVIAADPGVPDLPTNLASNAMLGKTLEMIRDRHDYELLAKVDVGDGLNYYIFRKVGNFHGWTQVTGLAPLEGPYPQWHLGQVRWGLGPATLLTLDADSPRDVILSMNAQSQLPGPQKLTVLLDRQPIAEHAFKTPGAFDAIAVPMHLTAGRHQVTLQYAHWLSDPTRQWAVLFASIEIDAAHS